MSAVLAAASSTRLPNTDAPMTEPPLVAKSVPLAILIEIRLVGLSVTVASEATTKPASPPVADSVAKAPIVWLGATSSRTLPGAIVAPASIVIPLLAVPRFRRKLYSTRRTGRQQVELGIIDIE